MVMEGTYQCFYCVNRFGPYKTINGHHHKKHNDFGWILIKVSEEPNWRPPAIAPVPLPYMSNSSPQFTRGISQIYKDIIYFQITVDTEDLESQNNLRFR